MPERGAPGRLILLLGPSGSGKDTLLAGLREHFADEPRVRFVRRAITRPPSPETEDHLPLDDEGFEALAATGHFAVTWQANGLKYALPSEALTFVENGGLAIANGSRGALPEIKRTFGQVSVVLVTVEENVLKQRLLNRGRETCIEINARLARNSSFGQALDYDMLVDNSGPPEHAIRHLRHLFHA